MPTLRFISLLTLAFIFINVPARAAATGRVFYVSPSGQDHWTGTLASANQNATNGPFATLERARDAVRSALATGNAQGGITVYIRRGVYRLRSTFGLDHRDSGSKEVPLVWRAYPGEEVTLTGSAQIVHWESIADSSIAQRLGHAVLAHIVQIDLRASQVEEFGSITPRGGPPLELFFHGKRMPPARWPNEGWLHIADVPQTGPKRFHEGLDREKRYDGVPIGRHYGRIAYSESRPSRWSKENDVFVHGYWTFDWSDSYQRVQSIDTLAHEL